MGERRINTIYPGEKCWKHIDVKRHILRRQHVNTKQGPIYFVGVINNSVVFIFLVKFILFFLFLNRLFLEIFL